MPDHLSTAKLSFREKDAYQPNIYIFFLEIQLKSEFQNEILNFSAGNLLVEIRLEFLSRMLKIIQLLSELIFKKDGNCLR